MEIKFEADTIKAYISIGIASYSKEIKNLEDMINSADKALYKAKAGGRNQLCTA
ncbi:GGDEF domain-containing protein [Dapis sp. BLCC M126]|uniref:GGDEF domain-containing protein n=1 Tax=Dapis sp. BLCC M126 TaxID=3400189 RepID=UPI003CE795BC